jgi:8-oxo-dGTP diphosphatase
MPPTGDSVRRTVRDSVARVAPFDERELQDQQRMLRWIDSGAPLFRAGAPATPPVHLATYVVLFDDAGREVLLIDHIKASRWLPPGGHVEPGEDPRRTAFRETSEELGIDAPFHPLFGDDPFFVTSTRTVGPYSHTDMTLWFLLTADRCRRLRVDASEARAAGWFPLDTALPESVGRFDPEWARAIGKLTSATPRRPLPDP